MARLIAEIGSAHDGSFGNACRLIEAAAASGADVVKLQTHIAEAETLADAPSPSYFTGESRFEYFQRTSFSEAQWRQLVGLAASVGVAFLSSPFSLEAVDLLEEVGVDEYKVPSGEVTNLPMLERIADTGKPVLLSSGMSNWHELDAAVATLARGGQVTLLQCSSIYPCPLERVGLNVMAEMRERYGLPVGFSDHTQGSVAAIAAVVLGATVIEKHFTFSRLMYGSDAPLATEPEEFRVLADAIRAAEILRTSAVDKDDLEPYSDMKRVFEKSVVTASTIPVGTPIEAHHLAFKKPGNGIRASEWRSLLGRRTALDLPADTLLSEDHLS